ncbi:M23 family metallopeptidase [Tsukamurella ocularis]|uniref:M23 family metallopeptidase n=1 Tax=Tsukamurella ocularis TaxID=1970234 RepID=UPI0039EE5815
MKLVRRTAAIATAVATAVATAGGVAEAAPTARVVAQTQKMTGPSLNSKQVGWYPAGARVTLQCYERGQSVKGALSKWHPNGGWDNLWYKTSDGVFVADIDIETGSNNPVTGACSGGAPAAQPVPAQSSSGWQRPTSGAIRNGFGANPAGYAKYGLPNGHNGVDFPVGVGTPVVAANDGVVAQAGWAIPWSGAAGGNAIIIRHSSVHTGYAHLSRIVVRAGQQVKKGQLIGYSGASGTAVEGAHLHFEALPLSPNFRNGFSGRINPAPYGGA